MRPLCFVEGDRTGNMFRRQDMTIEVADERGKPPAAMTIEKIVASSVAGLILLTLTA